MAMTPNRASRTLLLSALLLALGSVTYMAPERWTTSMKNIAAALDLSARKPLIDSAVPARQEMATFALG